MAETKGKTAQIIASGFVRALATTMVLIFGGVVAMTLSAIVKYDKVWYQYAPYIKTVVESFKDVSLVGIGISSVVLSYAATMSILHRAPRVLARILSVAVAISYVLYVGSACSILAYPIRQTIKTAYGAS
ncbi:MULTISPECIES: hypothetical protein [unclassified Devosia]|uniref:hypothetical protein n=1 Tax=unclassified Devosia TaxID=196773 RepID=UPI00145E721D|nr:MULTISPECIES: hypothetical protein [unclassified Devosia]MBJ6986257.1 hypothetical protein [Devosia sp. MC521]QMW64260.1 hypothetical protein H4N61_08170 [Devosia sp. MC521]